MSERRVSTLLLSGALLSGSITIVPILPVVLVLAVAHLLVTMFVTDRGIRISGPAKWYLLYMVLSFGYAALIGVDLLDVGLYRREFKFFVPFTAFIVFSSLRYTPSSDRVVFRTLVFLALANLALVAVSPLLLNLDLSRFYVDRGSIWDPYDAGLVYLGPFRSHSGAGSWFTAAALLLYGVSRVRDLRPRVRRVCTAASGLFAVLVVAGLSRASLLGMVAVFGHIAVGRRLPRRMYLFLGITGSLVAASIAVPYLSAQMRANSLFTLRGAASTSEYNILSRYVLWAKAVEDFTSSPLIGVGATRFDDEVTVIATFPQDIEEIYEVETRPRYFVKGPVRVNVGNSQAHTDQNAHNMYLHVLAEGGIVFFILLITVITTTVRRLREAARWNAGVRAGLAQGTLYAIYAVLIASGFGNGFLTVTPMFFVLSLAGYLNSVAPRPMETQPSVPLRSSRMD